MTTLLWKVRGHGEVRCVGMTNTVTGVLRPLTSEDIAKIVADLGKYGPRVQDYEVPVHVVCEEP